MTLVRWAAVVALGATGVFAACSGTESSADGSTDRMALADEVSGPIAAGDPGALAPSPTVGVVERGDPGTSAVATSAVATTTAAPTTAPTVRDEPGSVVPSSVPVTVAPSSVPPTVPAPVPTSVVPSTVPATVAPSTAPTTTPPPPVPTTQQRGSTTNASVQRRVVDTNDNMLWAELIVVGSFDADLEPYPWVRERCDLDWSVVKNVGVRIPDDQATAFAAALVRCNIDDLPNQGVARSAASLGSDSADRCVFSEFLQTMVSYQSGRLFLARLADPLPDDFLLEVTVRSVLSCGVTSGDPHAVHREMVAALLE